MDNDTDMKYIQKRNHKHVVSYNIRKWFKSKGKQIFFGAFPSLHEAKEYRDYLIKNDWDISLIHKPPLLYIHCNDGKYDVEPRVVIDLRTKIKELNDERKKEHNC